MTRTPADGPRVAVFAPAPALVCTFEHPHDRAEPDVALNVGGQGPWVARAVTALGATVILVVPVGGDTGQAAHHLLADEAGELRAVPVQAATACYIEERRDGERHCIRDAGPGRYGQRELDDIYSAALTAGLDAEVCVITGSPRADPFDMSFLTRLCADLAELGRTTVADLSGDQLDAALAGGVDWLKIAHDELPHLQEHLHEPGDDDLWAEADRLATVGAGPRNVVLSRSAGHAALVRIASTRRQVIVPTLTTVDPRGSGDAMTAALAVGLAERRPIDDILRRSAAAGAANAVHKGSATPDLDLVDRLAGVVEIEELASPDGPGGPCLP